MDWLALRFCPMRLPRFTTRRLMVLVAAAALLMSRVVIWQHQRYYTMLAAEHAGREQLGRALRRTFAGETRCLAVTVRDQEGVTTYGVDPGDIERYGRLRAKYERAARYPWLPAPTGPPPPE